MSSEQDINNANQDKNNAQQGKNNAEQDGKSKKQDITNSDQHDTNKAQSDTNTDVQEQLVSLQEKSDSMHGVILALTDSLKKNTESMTMVSNDLKDNLSVYLRIDERISAVEKYAAEIKEVSDTRAKLFRKLWKFSFLMAVVISVTLSSVFYYINGRELQHVCLMRNEAAASHVPAEAVVNCGSMLPWK